MVLTSLVLLMSLLLATAVYAAEDAEFADVDTPVHYVEFWLDTPSFPAEASWVFHGGWHTRSWIFNAQHSSNLGISIWMMDIDDIQNAVNNVGMGQLDFVGWQGGSDQIYQTWELSEIPIHHSKMFTAVWSWTSYATGNLPCAETNLARNIQGATMTASSGNAGVRVPSNTINGFKDPNVAQAQLNANSWIAASPGVEYLQLNFGEERNFNNIRVYQLGNRIENYRFEYLNDVGQWVMFHYGGRMMPGSSTLPPYAFTTQTTIRAQYIRMVSENSIGVTPIAVLEFEVYYMP